MLRKQRRLPAKFRFIVQSIDQHRRGELCVKSNMVYRLCNNMVYTFALGSPSSRYAFLSV